MTARILPIALLSACTCAPEAPPPVEGPYVARQRCPLPSFDGFVADESAFLARLESAFDAFDAAFDDGDWDEALACAQEATRLDPMHPLAHVDRGLAYDGLGLLDEAHRAYERAVAIAPDEPEPLRALADFLEREGTNDGLESALLLARRGRESSRDPDQGAELALVEARAANALGRSQLALEGAESSLALGDLPEALTERGIALFELTRIAEADKAFEQAQAELPEDARTLHWAGLVAEHQGRHAEAHTLLSRAATLDPEGFPLPFEVSHEQFEDLVAEEIAALPEEVRSRLHTEATLESAELPKLEDLRDAQTVLSPTILGLFRPGGPGGRSDIVLYRKNILRIVRTPEELRREVRDTLLHELGHLEGATDAELQDQGL